MFRKFLAALALVLCLTASVFAASPVIMGTTADMVSVGREYRTLLQAKNAIGSTSKVLAVKIPTTVSANLTLPSTLTLNVFPEGVITVDNCTLTIGKLVPGLHQMFNCINSGKVVLSAGACEFVTPQMWGSPGDGTSATTAIQDAINAGATAKIPIDIIGYHKFTKLYLYYDASLNPNFPSGYDASVNIRGVQEMDGSTARVPKTFGSILESTDATGPAIKVDAASISGSRCTKIRGLNILATNTTYVMDMNYFIHDSVIEDCLIYQKGTGSGVRLTNNWESTFRNVKIFSPSNTPANYGPVGLKLINTTYGGGMSIFEATTVTGWKAGFDIGSDTYNDGTLGASLITFRNSQAGYCEVGFEIGFGAAKTIIDGVWTENITHSAIRLRAGPKSTTIQNSYFIGDVDIAQIDIGYTADGVSGNWQTLGVTVSDCYITCPTTAAGGVGILVYDNSGQYRTIRGNTFWPQISGQGTAIKKDTNAGSLGSVIEENNFFNNLASDINDSSYSIRRVGRIEAFGIRNYTISAGATSINIERAGLFNVSSATAVSITDFLTTSNTLATGKVVVMKFSDANVTLIHDSAKLCLIGGANHTTTANEALMFVCSGTVWYEIGR